MSKLKSTIVKESSGYISSPFEKSRTNKKKRPRGHIAHRSNNCLNLINLSLRSTVKAVNENMGKFL